MRELAGKTAFVTGGANGIGLALGRAFAEAGMNVMFADIEKDALSAAVNSLHNFGPDVRGDVCDVTDPGSVERAANASYEATGWVRTRITESARNRSGRYGPARPPDPTGPASVVAELVQSGVDPSVVADRVLTAIREDQFYVFTHPEMRPAVEERFAAILAAMDKAAAS